MTRFVIRYGIQADIQADIQAGFLELFKIELPNAAHGLWAGSDILYSGISHLAPKNSQKISQLCVFFSQVTAGMTAGVPVGVTFTRVMRGKAC